MELLREMTIDEKLKRLREVDFLMQVLRLGREVEDEKCRDCTLGGI